MKRFFKSMFITLIVITLVATAAVGGMYYFRGNPNGSSDHSNKNKKEILANAQTEFKFNPHIKPARISKLYPDEYWEAVYNLIDAIREGKDTFKCKSQEAYDWASSPFTLLELYPPASYIIEDSFRLPENTYKNGVGKIVYSTRRISKEEYLKKQAAYEKDLMKVINDNVKPDYTDFEKCLALYGYICKTCSYDYGISEESMKNEPFVICRPLYEHRGICCELGDFYSYMLQQCGVDAASVSNDASDSDVGYHAWSLVTLDGKNYHVDPTWGLNNEGQDDGSFNLKYFMMTDKDREADLFKPKEFQLQFAKEVDITCTDTRFSALHNGMFKRIDRKKKVVYFIEDGKEKKFKYE